MCTRGQPNRRRRLQNVAGAAAGTQSMVPLIAAVPARGTAREASDPNRFWWPAEQLSDRNRPGSEPPELVVKAPRLPWTGCTFSWAGTLPAGAGLNLCRR